MGAAWPWPDLVYIFDTLHSNIDPFFYTDIIYDNVMKCL